MSFLMQDKIACTARVSWGGVRSRPGPNPTYNQAREPAHFQARLLSQSGFRSVFYWSARGPTTAHAPVHPFVRNPNQFLFCKFSHSETEPKASVVLRPVQTRSQPLRTGTRPISPDPVHSHSGPTPDPLGPTPDPLRTQYGPTPDPVRIRRDQSESSSNTARNQSRLKCILTAYCDKF
jgi:hypothetical protein